MTLFKYNRIVIILIFLLGPSYGAFPLPSIRLYEGYINSQLDGFPYSGIYHADQNYTMAISINDTDKYDFFIDQCTYGDKKILFIEHGCSKKIDGFDIKEVRNNADVKFLLVHFRNHPFSEIRCTVRVLECEDCVKIGCHNTTYFGQTLSELYEVTFRQNTINNTNTDIVIKSTVFKCKLCEIKSAEANQSMSRDLVTTCSSCAPFSFNCVYRCMRCELCPNGFTYQWYQMTPWWIWLLLALIPLILLLCCCLPWLFYFINKFRRRGKSTKTHLAAAPYYYNNTSQQVVSKDRDIQTAGHAHVRNINEQPRLSTTNLDECVSENRHGNHLSKTNDNITYNNDNYTKLPLNIGVQNITRVPTNVSDNFHVVTRVRVQDSQRQPPQSRQQFYDETIKMDNHAIVPRHHTSQPNASGGIYMKKSPQSEQPNEYGGVSLIRQPVRYSGQWEAYETEEIKESTAHRTINDSRERLAPNQVPIQSSESTYNAQYENYHPTPLSQPYPPSTLKRHRSSTSVQHQPDAPVETYDYDTEYRMRTSRGHEFPSTTKYPRSRSAHRDYYDSSTPIHYKTMNHESVPQVVFSSNSYPTSNEEIFREELVRTTRQSSAL